MQKKEITSEHLQENMRGEVKEVFRSLPMPAWAEWNRMVIFSNAFTLKLSLDFQTGFGLGLPQTESCIMLLYPKSRT